MPGTVTKRDESDFELTMEDLSKVKPTPMMVYNGRVLDQPAKARSVPIGGGRTKRVNVCIHRRLVTQPCRTCEYEAPRVDL